MFVDVAGTAKIERGKSPVFVRVTVLRKQFAAERKMRSEIALHQPAAVGMIALAGREIQNLAATAVSRPRPPAFLQPQGQLKPGLSVAQSATRIAAG